MRTILSCIASLAATLAQAHDGHGLSGGHWHATDTLGWIALALALGVLWISRK